MDIIDRYLFNIFPKLQSTKYIPTSPQTIKYNCIAWAVGDNTKCWWPDNNYYWPEGLTRESTVEAFTEMFSTFGYSICASEDLEEGFEKVALYVDDNNKPTHACRQLHDGNWTSKLGQSKDVSHSLHGLMSADYGKVGKIYKRPKA